MIDNKKLSHNQVIRFLKCLEKGWPDDLALFVGDDTLCLLPFNKESYKYGKEPIPRTPSGSVDSSKIIEAFPKIVADGSGW